MFAATEAGVRALWGSPLLGLAAPPIRDQHQLAEANTLGEFEGEALRVAAARTDQPLRETVPARATLLRLG